MAYKKVKEKSGKFGLLHTPNKGPQKLSPAQRASLQRALEQRSKTSKPKTSSTTRNIGKTEKNTGVVNRIFDVLSRGNYASAEAVRRGGEAVNKAQDKGMGTFEANLRSIDDIARGFSSGLQGKSKTTFADVVQGIADKNKKEGRPGIEGLGERAVVGGTGLALDVLLDPLTYTGIGLVGKAGKARKITAEVAAGRTYAAAAKSKPAKAAASRAAGEAVVRGLSKTEIKKAAATARQAYAHGLATKASQRRLVNDPRRLEVRFAGRNLLPAPVGAAVARGGGKVLEKVADTAPGQWANTAFRTATKFPGDTNFIHGTAKGRGAAQFNEWAQKTREKLKDLTSADAERVTYAREKEQDLTGVVGENGADLGDAQKTAEAILDDLFDRDVATGALKESDYIAKYVPHIFKPNKANQAKITAWKTGRRKAIGTETPAFTKKRTTEYTLEEAKAQGLDAHTDIREIINRRGQKSFETTARSDFVHTIAREYGVKNIKPREAKELGLVKLESKLMDETVYAPEDIARTLGSIERYYHNDEAAGTLLRFFDKFQRIWKTQATMIRPGFHVRNMLGDVFLNFEAGVQNPHRYTQALRLLRNPDTKLRIGHTTFTGKEIRSFYEDMGLSSSFYRDELYSPNTVKKTPIDVIRNASEARENYTRFVNFIDALVSYGKKIPPGPNASLNTNPKLKKAAEEAARRVRKYNFDYSDLTEFEKTVMKRMMPFYTFARKNLPLQIEMILTKPGRINTIPKTFTAVERLLGTDVPQTEEVENTIPNWLLEQTNIRVTNDEEPIFANLGLPGTDILGPFGAGNNPLAGISSSMTPALKVPIEYATGRSLFTGAPRDPSGEYAFKQLPFGSYAHGIANAKTDSERIQKILNFLGGTGLQQATLERQEFTRQQRKREADSDA